MSAVNGTKTGRFFDLKMRFWPRTERLKCEKQMYLERFDTFGVILGICTLSDVRFLIFFQKKSEKTLFSQKCEKCENPEKPVNFSYFSCFWAHLEACDQVNHPPEPQKIHIRQRFCVSSLCDIVTQKISLKQAFCPPPRHTLDASRILAFSHNSGLAKNSRTILAHSRTFSHILAPFSHILARFSHVLARFSVVTYVENTHPPTLFFNVFGSL